MSESGRRWHEASKKILGFVGVSSARGASEAEKRSVATTSASSSWRRWSDGVEQGARYAAHVRAASPRRATTASRSLAPRRGRFARTSVPLESGHSPAFCGGAFCVPAAAGLPTTSNRLPAPTSSSVHPLDAGRGRGKARGALPSCRARRPRVASVLPTPNEHSNVFPTDPVPDRRRLSLSVAPTRVHAAPSKGARGLSTCELLADEPARDDEDGVGSALANCWPTNPRETTKTAPAQHLRTVGPTNPARHLRTAAREAARRQAHRLTSAREERAAERFQFASSSVRIPARRQGRGPPMCPAVPLSAARVQPPVRRRGVERRESPTELFDGLGAVYSAVFASASIAEHECAASHLRRARPRAPELRGTLRCARPSRSCWWSSERRWTGTTPRLVPR